MNHIGQHIFSVRNIYTSFPAKVSL